MKHARKDYDRIQDPSGKIPEDEPVFLLRGQDIHAAKIVRLYADEVEAAGGDPEIVKNSREQADRMDGWGTKAPPDMSHAVEDYDKCGGEAEAMEGDTQAPPTNCPGQ